MSDFSPEVQEQLNKAQQSLNNGQLESACSHYENVLRLAPDCAMARSSLATIYQSFLQPPHFNGDQAQAFSHVLRLAELVPQAFNLETHLALAEVQLQTGEYGRARERLTILSQTHSNNIQLHERLSQIFISEGRLDQAIGLYEVLFERHPELTLPNNSVHSSLTLQAKLGRLIDEKEKLEDLLTSPSPTNEIAHHSIQPHVAAALRDGKLDEAVQLLRESVTHQPDFQFGYVALIEIFLSLASMSGRTSYFQDCDAVLFSAMTRWPDDSRFLFLRGRREFEQYWDPRRPVEWYKKALSIDPWNEAAALAMADCVTRLRGFYSDAEGYYRQYLEGRDKRRREDPVTSMNVTFLDGNATYAIGHLSELPDMLIKLQELGYVRQTQNILLVPKWRVSNQSLLDLWKKYFTVITDPEAIRMLKPLARRLDAEPVFTRITGRTLHQSLVRARLEREWYQSGREPLVQLTDADLNLGWSILEKVGIPRGGWFVTAHVREAGFKKDGDAAVYRFRNSDVQDYREAFATIVSRGGHVVRTGEASMRSLEPQAKVFDYAHSEHKSEFMDVFLFSQCRFLLTTTGGVYGIPIVFRKPVVFTNWPLGYAFTCTDRDFFLFMPPHRTSDGSKVDFNELLKPGVFSSTEISYFLDQNGITLRPNTPEEIREIVEETLDALDGRSVYTKRDNELQDKFRDLLPESELLLGRVGKAFLERHFDQLSCSELSYRDADCPLQLLR